MTVSIYNGPVEGPTLTFLRKWEAWAGRRAGKVTVNGATLDEWDGMISSIGWLVAMYLKNLDVQPIVGVPMLPKGPTHSIARYIVHWGDKEARYFPFHQMLTEIVKLPNPVVRLGWEFNGEWQPWFAKDPAQFVLLWRMIVDHARKNVKGGDRIKWMWCPSITAWNKIDVSACYPGDDYVDQIAVDLYDIEGPDDPADRWALARDCKFGLGWAAKFARDHGKPFSIAEVGAGSHGDNPYFVEQLATFAKANGCDVFWWGSDADYPAALMGGKRPKQATSFRKMLA